MVDYLQDVMKDTSIRTPERLELALQYRFQQMQKNKDLFRKIVKYLLHPIRSPLGLKYAYQTVNTLWYTSGDRATDYNHYTKRLLLSGVLASTTLYWLRDTSDDYSKTWVFLDRRIQNVMTVGGYMAKIKQRFE